MQTVLLTTSTEMGLSSKAMDWADLDSRHFEAFIIALGT